MSDSINFINSYASNIRQLISILSILDGQNQQLTDDPTLVTRYFASVNPTPRADITATDVSNAASALVQVLFAYNSGSPTQRSFLLKMTP